MPWRTSASKLIISFQYFDPYSTMVSFFASFWVCESVNSSIISSRVPKPPGNTTSALAR